MDLGKGLGTPAARSSVSTSATRRGGAVAVRTALCMLSWRRARCVGGEKDGNRGWKKSLQPKCKSSQIGSGFYVLPRTCLDDRPCILQPRLIFSFGHAQIKTI